MHESLIEKYIKDNVTLPKHATMKVLYLWHKGLFYRFRVTIWHEYKIPYSWFVRARIADNKLGKIEFIPPLEEKRK